jgi:hypothetical protein
MKQSWAVSSEAVLCLDAICSVLRGYIGLLMIQIDVVVADVSSRARRADPISSLLSAHVRLSVALEFILMTRLIE